MSKATVDAAVAQVVEAMTPSWNALPTQRRCEMTDRELILQSQLDDEYRRSADLAAELARVRKELDDERAFRVQLYGHVHAATKPQQAWLDGLLRVRDDGLASITRGPGACGA